MAAHVTTGAGAGLDDAAVLALLRGAGLAPQFWSAPGGERFAEHEHPNDKILYVVDGALTFLLADGSVHAMATGDRIDLEAATVHAAVAGSDGVRCIEAFAAQP